MTRAHLNYRDAAMPLRSFDGVDPDTPVEGYYRFRMRSGGVFVGVKVWYGPPNDPDTGEEMDRSWRWQALVNDGLVDIERVWPSCSGEPVDLEEYRHLCGLQAWAKANAPLTALADPRRKVDLLASNLPF